MVSFDELKRTLTSRLFENASDRRARAQLTGREIANMLHDLTGYAIAGQVRNELLQNGLLRQVRAISDDEEGEYEITPNLIREIESLQASISSKAGETTFSEFKKCLIVALYEKSNAGGLNLYPLKDLADEKGLFYREGWIFEVLTFLDEHGYALIVKSMGGDGTAAAKLKASGLEYAEELIAEAESEENAPEVQPLVEIAGSSDTVIDDGGIPLVAVPASDRIVKLDHNSAEYRETIAALSELSEEAKKSNEFGELFVDPEDKVVVLSQIDNGIQLLTNKKVIPDVVKRVLEYPLRFIKEKMPDAALGALASKAWDWLMKLIENVI